MHIHQVVLVPGAAETLASRGRFLDRFSDTDVIDQYAWSLADQLERDDIRYKVLNTRRPPGMDDELDLATIEANSLILCLHVGWFKAADRKTNESTVFYNKAEAKRCAIYIGDVLAEWGSCAAFGHRSSNPRAGEPSHGLPRTGPLALRIEPFAMNGPYAQDYLKRLPQLGRDIGRTVADYLKMKGWAQRGHVLRAGQTLRA